MNSKRFQSPLGLMDDMMWNLTHITTWRRLQDDLSFTIWNTTLFWEGDGRHDIDKGEVMSDFLNEL